MSDTTEQALYNAIDAHFADEVDGAMTQGWILNIVGQTIEDALHNPDDGTATSYMWLTRPGQLRVLSVGLAHDFIRQQYPAE